ncbi:hypothetical protein [Synechococcus phage S-B68]|nr:hypothetical protein [Synechococcus phage S-B68]
MSLSKESINGIAESLAPEFVAYLGTDPVYERLSEVLSDAVSAFIDEKLGEIDDELYYDLALATLEQVRIVTQEELFSCLVARSHGSL